MSPLFGAVTSASVLLGGLGPNPVPAPTGGPRELDPNTVTPGVMGFLATAAVVFVSILLILNLVHRMRRIRHRGAVEEAALAAREEALRERSLDPSRAEQDDDERRAAEAASAHDVVQGEVRGEPREARDAGGAPATGAHRYEPDTPDSPRT